MAKNLTFFQEIYSCLIKIIILLKTKGLENKTCNESTVSEKPRFIRKKLKKRKKFLAIVTAAISFA